MPVWRFTFEEAERALWLPPGDPGLVGHWRALEALAPLAPHCPPMRGVRKFRTIEEANEERDAWIARCVEAGRQRIREQTRRT